MRGHIVKPNPKRSNLWGFVVELPRDPVTGKRRQKMALRIQDSQGG